MPETLSTIASPSETPELPHSGHFISARGEQSVGANDTNSPTVDVAHQATVLRHADELIEALSRRWSDAAYLARVGEWANELREEMRLSPKVLRGQVDEVYDEAYAELAELERRIL